MKETLSHFPMIGLSIAGQLIFMAVFAGVGFWVFRRNSNKFYNKLANIALEQEGTDHGK